MEGSGFDLFSHQSGSSAAGFNYSSQATSSAGAHNARVGFEALDLNSQAQAMSDAAAPAQFPHLEEYGNLLVGDGVLPPVRAQRTLGVRAPRVGRGGGVAGAGSTGRARQLQFGGPSSAAGVNRGGSSSAGAGGRRRRAPAPSAAVGGGGRRQRGRGRGLPLVPPVAPQAPSGEYDNLDDEDDEENDYEDNQGSSDAHPDGGDEDISEEHGDSTSSSDGEVFEVARENIRWTNDFIARIAPLFGMYFDKFFFKQPRRVEGESGFEWVQRTLGRSTSCYNMFRVEPPLFHRLHNTLVESYGLQSTAKMTSIEALAMFLWVIGAPQSVRQAEDRFRRSLETVSRNFDIVLRSVLKLAADIIKPKDPEFSIVHPVLENANFWPHFNDCIGALDGTHVKVVVPKKLLIQHMNRHNETSQNVLAVCDFDMKFTFVLAGWPGSVHDMRVFTDAITKYVDKFPHPPPGKFYAVDAGYPNRPGYLSPYRCTRYHVDQWQNGPGLQGMKETFNHAHSQVRNVIERSFGVLKMKWRILLNMPKFSTRKQTRLIVACMALHNFVRETRIADREFAMCDEDANYFPMPPASSQDSWPQDEPLIEDANMNAFHDQLATALYHG